MTPPTVKSMLFTTTIPHTEAIQSPVDLQLIHRLVCSDCWLLASGLRLVLECVLFLMGRGISTSFAHMRKQVLGRSVSCAAAAGGCIIQTDR